MEYLTIIGYIYIVCVVWKWEREDWYKVEEIRKDILKKTESNEDDIVRIMNATERMRRVTWRMGICGAALLSFVLIQCNVISWSQFGAAAVPSWILLTSVLNFRAYHLEDEQTMVLRHYLKST